MYATILSSSDFNNAIATLKSYTSKYYHLVYYGYICEAYYLSHSTRELKRLLCSSDHSCYFLYIKETNE